MLHIIGLMQERRNVFLALTSRYDVHQYSDMTALCIFITKIELAKGNSWQIVDTT